MQCGGFGYNQETQKRPPQTRASGAREGVEMSKEERELVLPLGVVVLVVLGVWLWRRRR